MDVTTAFKSELFRPFVTLIIPGGVATGPWLLVIDEWYPAVPQFLDHHSAAAWLCVLSAMVATGLVLENLGSNIEVYAWDRCLSKKRPSHQQNWHRYLRLNTQDQIVGQRYLRSVLIWMKFELAMVPAMAASASGLAVLQAQHAKFGPHGWWTVVVAVVAGLYFTWASYDTAELLSETRDDVLAACGKNPRAPAV